MEKYARILIIIFFLTIINLFLNLYILKKLNKPITTPPLPVVVQKTATSSPQPIATPTITIQSDLNLIKAEIRALRESLNSSGLIVETPKP